MIASQPLPGRDPSLLGEKESLDENGLGYEIHTRHLLDPLNPRTDFLCQPVCCSQCNHIQDALKMSLQRFRHRDHWLGLASALHAYTTSLNSSISFEVRITSEDNMLLMIGSDCAAYRPARIVSRADSSSLRAASPPLFGLVISELKVGPGRVFQTAQFVKMLETDPSL